MRALRPLLWSGLAVFALAALIAAPAHAQGRATESIWLMSMSL